MNNLCIIPARGGSKRIPRKNVKSFLGKPIIAYSIELALDCDLFSEIMVSTEDEEIAEIAKQYGAKIPFIRSAKNSNDFATTSDVILEVLEEYQKEKIFFENICCIYPTAPLSTKNKVVLGYEKLKEEKLDSVFPVVPYSYPIWRGLKQSNDKRIKMIWPENRMKRSQDLEETYHDAGQWYWITSESIIKNKSLFTTNSSAIILSPLEVQDIDTINDWEIAELKYARIQNTK